LSLLESRVQEDAAKLVALSDAAKVGTDAIERGEFTVLENKQDIVNIVRKASERANSNV
jgi:hypothetical protein